MKITAKAQGLVATGVTNHIGDILLGADPKKAINGIVSDIANEAVSTLTSQTSSIINSTINNVLSDKLDDILLAGDITGNLSQIKNTLIDKVNDKINSVVNSVLPDDINFLTNNITSIKDSVSIGIDEIKSDLISSVLNEFSDDIPDIGSVTSQLNSVIDTLVSSQVSSAIDSITNNFGKDVKDLVDGGLDSILGKDLASQLGDAVADEVMSAMSGFKLVVGSALKKTIVGQGNITVGGGSKMSSILPGSISLGSGASLLKLGAGMISMGSGSSKVSIGDGDIKIGGESAINKSPVITLNISGDIRGSADVTLSNLTSNTLNISVLKAVTPVNKGNITTAVSFNMSEADVQKITSTGSHSWSFTNWPAGYRQIRILTTNAGLGSITFPTMTWFKGDGTSYSSFSSIGVTLNSSGPNVFDIWSPDGGITIFGRAF